MGRANRGIYCGVHIRFGNNVSHSAQHTRRHFKPNTQSKWFPSVLLEEQGARVTVTTTALRTIRKLGGLDQFLLNSKYAEESALSRELRKRALTALEINPSLSRPVANLRRPRLPKGMQQQPPSAPSST